ncbi:MAG: hypothetical protein WCI02_17440 [Planctomycetota bacterium]
MIPASPHSSKTGNQNLDMVLADSANSSPGNDASKAVLKIGGATLFSNVSWESLIEPLRGTNPTSSIYGIVGGGDTVDSMRALQKMYPQLSTEEMHWRCIRLLDATWEIACELLPRAIPIATMSELQRSLSPRQPSVYLVRISAFYSPEAIVDLPSHWLPKVGWETTTDALAWLLAKITSADRVWIVKQCDCQSIPSLHDAALRGIIDPELARLANVDNDGHSIRIELVRA